MQNRRIQDLVTTRFMTALLVGCMFAFSPAYADTYNFFFSKPGKKGAKGSAEQSPAAAPTPAPDSDEDDEASEESPAAESASPAVAAPPAAPVPDETTKTSSTSSTAPIVINNNIQGLSPAPAPAPVAAPDVSESPSKPASTLARDEDDDEHAAFDTPVRFPTHPFKIGLSLQSFNYTSVDWNGFGRGGDKQSLGLSLGYAFNKHIHWALYASTSGLFDRQEIPFYGGTDLEIYPISLGNKRHEIFQLGFILGASTAAGARDNLGSLHTGARMNVQMNENFAITLASRINLGHSMTEAGIITRF